MFDFQYFNPLNAKEYYKNLDEQVLSLITSDIGSMPDLKKPKTIHKYEVEEHTKVITSPHKKNRIKIIYKNFEYDTDSYFNFNIFHCNDNLCISKVKNKEKVKASNVRI
ncbi:SdrH family protein [Staphylococcus hominis]